MKKVSFSLLMMMVCLFAINVTAQDFDQQIMNHFKTQLENNELQASDVQWNITGTNTSRTSGVHHIYFRQELNGLDVYGTESGIHITSTGDVIAEDSRFISQVSNRTSHGVAPNLGAVQAVQKAANYFGYNITESLNVISREQGVSQETKISKGGISLSDIPARLMYQVDANEELVLVWDVSIEEVSRMNWWNVRINAMTGTIVDQVNWMVTCADLNHDHSHDDDKAIDHHKNLFDIPNYVAETAEQGGCVECYEVFGIPTESPLYGPRTILTNPAHPIASPFGWHDTNGAAGAEFTDTEGNNVDAFDANTGFQPDGGTDLVFTGFPFDIVYTNATQYESSSITQLFYLNNVMHDIIYLYGMDEAGGNFQVTNYTGQGAGGDSVNANAQIGVNCNATFGTPPDGSSPSMNMFICNDRDGDFDNLVVFHEYGHGVSNRLTGGPNNTGCLGNSEQMGEGWSDYLGAIFTIEPGDVGTDVRGVGTYLFGQSAGGNGIRPFPYSTDMGVNPHTYSDISSVSIPHGVGSVWAMMLWELTWELIDEHGFDNNIFNFTGDVNLDAGNIQALALVMEGMKMQPCNPGFVDGRDAIFAADQALYGGANECLIWDAFARRGLGLSADQGSSNSVNDGTEAFDTPSGVASFTAPNDVCEGSPVLTDLGGGNPFGGVYSGPGVTDDGNGSTYSFDPVAAGPGVHTISYEVQSGACSIASTDTDDIEVLAISAAPATTGDSIICGEMDATVTATPNNATNVIYWYDAPTGGNFIIEGPSYTFSPTLTTSVYAQERPPAPTSKLVISELTFETPDRLEIQNVGDAFDYTGYTVALSDEPFGTLNNVNPVTQTLGNMGADSVVAWSDDAASGDYWGSNIWWGNGDGWVLIIDPAGNVVDSVFWNMTEATIATFNVTVNGFNITASDLDFIGDGVSLTVTCNNSFRRVADTDTGADFLDACLASDFGTPNTDIGDVSGDLGCLGARGEAEVIVGADTIDPTITCPADETVTVNNGEQFTLLDYTPLATAADNCTPNPAKTQTPAAGTQVGPGTTTVTITATDDAGNDVSCTFDIIVEELLSVEDVALENGVTLFPNPTTGMLTLRNDSSLELTNAVVTDVNGRIINTINLSSAGTQTTISLESVATGLYFVKINSETSSIVKRIVKR